MAITTSYPVSDQMDKRLKRDFQYHKVDEEQAERMQAVRDACYQLAYQIVRTSPPGREQSLALTALETVSMQFNAGVARLEATDDTEKGV